MALELKLSKPGDAAPKLSLNLAKPARFTVAQSYAPAMGFCQLANNRQPESGSTRQFRT